MLCFLTQLLSTLLQHNAGRPPLPLHHQGLHCQSPSSLQIIWRSTSIYLGSVYPSGLRSMLMVPPYTWLWRLFSLPTPSTWIPTLTDRWVASFPYFFPPQHLFQRWRYRRQCVCAFYVMRCKFLIQCSQSPNFKRSFSCGVRSLLDLWPQLFPLGLHQFQTQLSSILCSFCGLQI